MEPGGREPAPGGLELVQAFVNTLDIEAGRDEMGTVQGLVRWLSGRGLLAADHLLTEDDLRRAVELREGLRALMLANNTGAPEAGAVETLNRVSVDASIVVAFDRTGEARLAPARPGLHGALGVILSSVYTAMADGIWPRLKVCRNDGCRWAFYDHSKNRSGTWCTMAICGSRVKTRNYRQRRRTGS